MKKQIRKINALVWLRLFREYTAQLFAAGYEIGKEPLTFWGDFCSQYAAGNDTPQLNTDIPLF